MTDTRTDPLEDAPLANGIVRAVILEWAGRIADPSHNWPSQAQSVAQFALDTAKALEDARGEIADLKKALERAALLVAGYSTAVNYMPEHVRPAAGWIAQRDLKLAEEIRALGQAASSKDSDHG